MKLKMNLSWLLLLAAGHAAADVEIPRKPVGNAPALPLGRPHEPPAYMKSNINNYFGTAPDKGTMKGPKLNSSNNTKTTRQETSGLEERAADDYWLSALGSEGKMPFASSGYEFFRNVKDFGAKGDGKTDDTAAINRAAANFAKDNKKERCGKDCGSTTTMGALIYFPPGTYVISSPIIQYYYSQFVGNPDDKAVLKGAEDFSGIALVDGNFYIPGGNSAQWYINQSNFYRQIRNLVFDMTAMNWTNMDGDQEYVPAGIHWQVGQGTSITNCDFKMAVSTPDHAATGVGIYMENGSGGMVSDLTFLGGNIGFLAGSQQFTASNLKFTSCLTAIKQQWNWGFTWKNIYVLSCYIAIDCTAYSGVTKQGTGSIAVVDSHFNGVPYAITVKKMDEEQPTIVLDNLLVENSQSVVLVSGGDTLLAGSSEPLYFDSWVTGYDTGAYYRKEKPQYSGADPVVATKHGIKNDATGDQTDAINSLLSGNVGSVIYFPAGVYIVKGTVKVPVGSKIIGSGWSQIMGTGSYFEDVDDPKVMVQVGTKGDSGVMEITDMLFTVKGPTAGAILMEWNVHESSQGSAAMWDSHFRVGGAKGSDLQLEDCPIHTSASKKCMAASMLMHITSDSSGYFDNVWAWVADHDLDNPLNAKSSESNEGIPLNVETDISIYVGRGILIESQGPTWLYGSSSEHSQMYQYQLLNAQNVYMGHMQTETPYYQPNPNAMEGPYDAGQFPSDPKFGDCADDSCKSAWALRVLNSSDIFIYSAGFYSFFQDNELGCTSQENCQRALIETNYANGLWMYNTFTKGNIQIFTPRGDLRALLFNSTTKNGYTSEIAAWLALSTGGDEIGSDGDGSGIVTLDPDLWKPSETGVTMQCHPPCTYVFPPLTLPSDTTFKFPKLTTRVEVGWNTTTTYTYLGKVTTSEMYTKETQTTTITIEDVTTSVIPLEDVVVTENSTVVYPVPHILPGPVVLTDKYSDTTATHTKNTRTFFPPPWPGKTAPSFPTITPTTTPTTTRDGSTSGSDSTSQSRSDDSTSHDKNITPVTHTNGPPKPTCTHVTGCGKRCKPGLHGLKWVFCNRCWFGCGGKDDPNFHDSNDPDHPPPGSGGPDDGDDDECETKTYSSCRTECIDATPTPHCSPTCHDVVGCDATSTSTAVTYTHAPVGTMTAEEWLGWGVADWPAAQAIWSSFHAQPTGGSGDDCSHRSECSASCESGKVNDCVDGECECVKPYPPPADLPCSLGCDKYLCANGKAPSCEAGSCTCPLSGCFDRKACSGSCSSGKVMDCVKGECGCVKPYPPPDDLPCSSGCNDYLCADGEAPGCDGNHQCICGAASGDECRDNSDCKNTCIKGWIAVCDDGQCRCTEAYPPPADLPCSSGCDKYLCENGKPPTCSANDQCECPLS